MSLSSIVREAIDNGVGPDPRDIAAKVMESIPFDSEREYLEQLLPDFCREILRKNRHDFTPPETQVRSSSGKVEGKWAHARSVFQLSVYANGNWRHLGDLTPDDVDWIISDYSKQIEAAEGQVRKYVFLRNLMRRHGAVKVSDLPVGKVEGVMS